MAPHLRRLAAAAAAAYMACAYTLKSGLYHISVRGKHTLSAAVTKLGTVNRFPRLVDLLEA